jgi:hypothetical protein
MMELGTTRKSPTVKDNLRIGFKYCIVLYTAVTVITSGGIIYCECAPTLREVNELIMTTILVGFQLL